MRQLLDFSNRIYLAVLLISFLSIIVCVIMQIVSRYIFNQPLTWTEELSLLGFCWFTFIGSAACSWDKSHLEVDFFYNRMGEAGRKVTDLLIMFLVALLSAFMVFDSVIAMRAQFGITSVALRLPISLYSLAILVGFSGMFTYTSYHLFRHLKTWRL